MPESITSIGPHWAEVAKNVATVIGIVAGGAWAFWKWGYSEWHASRQNRASLDGTISASGHGLKNGAVLVTVSSQWNNRGSYPILIDPKKSVVQIAELPDSFPVGPVEPRKILELAEHVIDSAYFEQYPFLEFDAFEFEPKTESSVRAHFVLSCDRTYLIRWTLFKNTAQNEGGIFCWTKELVWHCEPSSTPIKISDA